MTLRPDWSPNALPRGSPIAWDHQHSYGIVEAIYKKTQWDIYIEKWNIFCHIKDIELVKPSLRSVTDFLTELLEQGLGYSALNTARSALSNLIYLDGRPVGEHPTVVQFLKGVFNLKPSMPKTYVSWDPQIFLKYLKTLSPVRKLMLNELTFKLVALVWLLSGQRGQSLQLISTKNITVTKQCVKIRFGGIMKTTRPGFQQQELVLKDYAQDRRLCIVTVLQEYLKRTSGFRNSKNHQLFVSIYAPHNGVSRDTISRWVRTVMQNAGLDTSIFSPHSVRAASKVQRAGPKYQ